MKFQKIHSLTKATKRMLPFPTSFFCKVEPSSGERSDELSAHRDIPPKPTFLIHINNPILWYLIRICSQASPLISVLTHCPHPREQLVQTFIGF